MNGTLSIVSTPIGNLEDMTLRAIRVLKESDYILCEDTRVTGKLLKHYDIETKMKRYDAHASERVHEQVLKDLAEGKRIALVSDAGTPSVSDPGMMLVARVQKELPNARIETVPGASALTAALSISGIPASEFLFLGFLPHKKGRHTLFLEIAASKRPVVFYESPHRIRKTLQSMSETLTDERTVTIARELTKMFEEVIHGTPAEMMAHFENNPDTVRGEFVVIVS